MRRKGYATRLRAYKSVVVLGVFATSFTGSALGTWQQGLISGLLLMLGVTLGESRPTPRKPDSEPTP